MIIFYDSYSLLLKPTLLCFSGLQRCSNYIPGYECICPDNYDEINSDDGTTCTKSAQLQLRLNQNFEWEKECLSCELGQVKKSLKKVQNNKKDFDRLKIFSL